MTAASTNLPGGALQDAQLRPWAHGFMPLLRKLAAAEPAMPLVGQAQRPQQESFRLGQQASLAFAPREVARVEVQQDSKQRPMARIKLFGLGTLGPNGALPIHFTELVRERVEAKRDNTLADFIDLFHHRAFTHIYRAWAQSQSAAGLDRAGEETFSPYIARLAGDDRRGGAAADLGGTPAPVGRETVDVDGDERRHARGIDPEQHQTGHRCRQRPAGKVLGGERRSGDQPLAGGQGNLLSLQRQEVAQHGVGGGVGIRRLDRDCGQRQRDQEQHPRPDHDDTVTEVKSTRLLRESGKTVAHIIS